MSDVGVDGGMGGAPAEHDGEEFDDDYEPEPKPLWVKIALIAAVLAVIGLGVGIGLHVTGSSGPPATPSGPEGVPLQNVPDLAPAYTAGSSGSGQPVDGVTCRPTMLQNVSYHIHVHLDIFVNGQQERIPAGAGMVPPLVTQAQPGGLFYDNSPSSCLYWLHVHATDGIIHVESPTKRTFVLGNFFDIWGQPLGPNQVGPATGPVVAFVNGKVFSGNPRDIPLLSQEVVQLDVGTPVVAFKPMKFTVTGSCSLTCSAITSSS